MCVCVVVDVVATVAVDVVVVSVVVFSACRSTIGNIQGGDPAGAQIHIQNRQT